MYSWGDDTNTWKNPGAYDFGSARKPYLDDLKSAADGPRSYATKTTPVLKLVDPKGKNISTQSEHPVVICVDGTGSMQTWPAEIFDRLPLLYQTLSKYKPDVEISFSVIGDANCDNWPVQASDFGKGVTLDDYLKALKPEGGGGGGMHESYELWAYFMQEHAKTPKATTPMMVIMGDEKFYDTIKPEQVQHYLGDTLQGPVCARDVWKSLGQRFDIYLLRKSYGAADPKIEAQWAEAIGKQKILPIADPTRCVDVAMGLIAKQWGYFGDFETNLSARQDTNEIAKVMTSLRAVSAVDKSLKSKITGGGPSKKTKGLLEDHT